MNLIVSNSSPLIIAGKINELDLLKALYKQISIPKEVYTEVVEKGKEKNEPDALLIEDAVNDGWIKVESLDKDEIENAKELHNQFRLSRGESEAIILAKRYKNCTLILDDLEARDVARAKGIMLSDTLIMPLEALASGKISYTGFKRAFEKIIEVMKPKADKIFKILEEAEKWRKQS